MQFINIHTHHPVIAEGIFELVNLLPADTVSEQPRNNVWFSSGMHPWHLLQADAEYEFEKLERLVLRHKRVIAVGEAGLDKICKTDWSVQEYWFEKQIELSEKAQKPLIIHCLKAYNEILSFRKKTQPSQAWIIHGFNSSKQQALDLIDHGCYLSIGDLLLNKTSKIQQILPELPLENIFLETDDEPELAIETIYLAVAKAMKIHPKELRPKIKANFERVFGVGVDEMEQETVKGKR